MTRPDSLTVLDVRLQKTSAGICTPEDKGDKMPLFPVACLCPSKIKSVPVRYILVMVGCIRQPQGWPAPLSGSANLIQPASLRFAPMEGGISSNKGGHHV